MQISLAHVVRCLVGIVTVRQTQVQIQFDIFVGKVKSKYTGKAVWQQSGYCPLSGVALVIVLTRVISQCSCFSVMLGQIVEWSD